MSESMSLRQLQKMETEVLQVFHDFCEEHHLTYYLFAGTLLGAIRHKGFIPWDDDADVLMPRPDYEKFVELFPKYNKLAHVRLATMDTPNYYLAIAKVYDNRFEINERCLQVSCPLGPWVDVFPLDNMGDTMQQVRKLYKDVRFWHGVKEWRTHKKRVKKLKHLLFKILRPCFFFVPTRTILRRLDKTAQRYAGDQFTTYVFNVTQSPYPPEKVMLSAWFSGRELHEFEGHQFYIPSGYHELLTNFYDDYMTPLPPEQRRAHFDRD